MTAPAAITVIDPAFLLVVTAAVVIAFVLCVWGDR